MSAVSGTDRITPMLLDMPLTTSIARYDELSSWCGLRLSEYR